MYFTEKAMNKVVTVQKIIDGKLWIEEGKKYLKCSERTIYRYIKRYREEWPPWLEHGLIGRKSNNRNRKKRMWIERYCKKKCYQWFWPTLMSEKLEEYLGYRIPVESLRRRMIERWLWVQRKPREIKRRPRERKGKYGMMIQFDGSYHDRLENGKERCLLLWIDDATGKVMHVSFAPWETIKDVIEYWKSYFKMYGKPWCIYLDRHASYKVNHRKDQFDHSTLTRFQTAMWKLWVHIIYARSAQGKWRVERMFKTMQDRGIKELRLAGIKDYEKAIEYLREKIIPEFNRKFWVIAKEKGDIHQKLSKEEKKEIDWYFAKKSERKINKVWVVSYDWKKYILERGQSLEWHRWVDIYETHKGLIRITQDKKDLSYTERSY